jgi:diguanylate cyclase (GGDEF)-like protein
MALLSGLDFRRSPKGPVIALLASVLLLCAYFAANIWTTMSSAEALAMARTTRAVNATFSDQAAQLERLAEDNAYWNEAYRAVVRPSPDKSFIWDTWGSVTTGDLYDQAFVIDDQGQMLFNFKGAAEASLSDGQRMGNGLNALRSRLGKGKNRTAGMIKYDDDNIMIVGLARIRPVDLGLQASNQQQRQYFLGLARHIEQHRLDALGENLALTGLSFKPRSGADTMLIKLASSEKVALYWEPFIPGNIALKQALPFLALGFLAIMGVIGLLTRFGMEAVEEVNRMALIDPLSQLPNRRAIRSEMEKRFKSGEPMALAFIDLDGFKAVNDAHGHAVGDALIIDYASMLKDVAANCAMVARLGGDEFAILFVGKTSQAAIRKFSERLMKRLRRPFRLGERTIIVGASIGLSVSPGSIAVAELMRRADIAMYASKTEKKGKARWFEKEFDHQRSLAAQIELDLDDAIRSGDIKPRYQPVIDVRTGRIVAIEALARWSRADGARVPPSVFIPVAEQCGLIAKLGDQLIRNAIADALKLGEIRLTINLSPFQLRHPEFAPALGRILAETNFPAERIELDIKEGFLIEAPVHANEILKTLHAMGIVLVLDDFGSGPTSIGFLRQFRFGKVKLAPSCIADAQVDEVARAIIQTTVSLAHRLSMRVVAEGVETAEQADFMMMLGCDELQGWFFSKSLALSDLQERLNGQSLDDILQGVAA